MSPAFPPYCGAEFSGQVAGPPVICDRERHLLGQKHRNSETGFEWWGFASYPRSGGK